MFNGLKAQRRLALYVALGLSAGSCTCLDASSAYAADVVVGVGENQSGDVVGSDASNNTVTIGAEGGGDHPVIGGNVAGANSTTDTSGNVVTIHSINATASGHGTIYGGIAVGTASGNKVTFNGGTATSLVGGTTSGASGSAQGNTVTVSSGNLRYVWGGLATAGSGSATGNIVNINGGTFSSGGVIIGGGGMNGVTGNMSGNTVTITGGALNNNNKIYAGDSRSISSTSNGNIVNLGDENGNFSANLNRAEIWGTSYGGQVQDNDSDKIKGNTLNVNASGIRLEKVRNFEKINFNLTPTVTAGSTMLTMDTGSFGLGYGKAFDWKNFSLTGKENDTDNTKYGRIGNINLLFAYSGSDMKIGNYTTGGKKGTTGDYEYHMESNGHTFFGEHVASLIKANVDRFKNADATADNVTGTAVYGGYSSLGNTTTNNKIKVTNTNNTNLTVYGGYTAGDGNATNNHVTITATGKVKAAYGGYATAANGKAEDNTVTVETGGWVDNSSYAGWAKGAVNRNIFTVKGHADWSVTGGNLDGSGTAEGNEVRVEGGLVKGYATGAVGGANSTVTGNKVTVTGGTVKKNISGGQSSGANGKATGNTVAITDSSTVEGIVNGGHMTGDGTASGNEVTISGSTIKQSVNGGYSSASGTVTGNTITVSGSSTLEKAVYGGYADTTGTVTGNTVNISDGTFQKRVYGGYSDKSGTVTGNKVTITGGTFQDHVYGGAGGDNGSAYTAQNFAANNNTVTIAGGTFSGNIYGGVSWKLNGTATGNTVNLGDDTHTDISGTTLTNADIYGGKYSGNGTGTGDYVTGNTLSVNAKNAAAKSVNNFENYKFKLNSATAFGDTMLTVTNAGDFAGTGVDWSKLTVDRTALSDVSSLHGIQRITLLKRSNAADTLKFQNYGATENGTATETHEFGLVTDTDIDEANAVLFEVSRFKGSEVAYDGTTETYAGAYGKELYGGLSRYGHTTTGNTLTVTGLRGTDDPKYAFGGINKGATGDVKNNTLNIDLANAGDTIDEVYAGEAENANNAGEVSGNIANMKKGTVNKLYGGHTFGTGAVEDNTVNFSGGTATDYVAGAYVDNTANAADITGNKVVFTGGTAVAVEGGAGKGAGALKNNTVTFSGAGSTADTLRGANSEGQGLVEENSVTISGGTVAHAYGAVTDGTGEAKKNFVTITDGTVNTEIAGGVGYKATSNSVTISGGTVGGDIYGGRAAGPGSSASGNTVNLGAEDGTYTADLTNAALHGDNDAGTGATLNVRAKNITTKSADKFANYKFHLNDDIAQNGGSMLMLTENNGFNGGNPFDWTKLDVDTTGLSGNTVIGNATLLTGTTNGLKFSNYAGRNKTTAATNGDYETALRTDTNTGTASKVILDYNRFQNNTNATYDGSTPATTLPDGTTEVYGGISYAGNTTTNNHLTVTGVQGNLTSAYGGKTAGARGDATGNSVTVEQTGTGAISNVIGGSTSSQEATAKAEDNTVTIKDGTFGAVYGGYVTHAANATDNHVRIEGGTVQNAVVGGGGTSTATGSMSDNSVTITGGTVTGYVIGGDARVLTSTSNKNVINLGDNAGTFAANLSGAQLWGTSYNGNVLANDDAKLADNTLNIKAKNSAEVAKVRNVQKFNFLLHDDTIKTAPLLTIADADGFGKVSADNSDVKVAWANVTADPSRITTAVDAATVQGKNTYTLMRGANNALKFSDYAARYDTHGGVYETGLRTDTGTNTATEVLYEVNRFKDGRVTYTAASAGDAFGGYSAFGNKTEGNKLMIEGVTGALAAAYGAQTAGTAGDSVGNAVTLVGTGTGAVTNVYGGAITNAANTGDVTGNTVTLTGGTVTDAVYGGYTNGSGKTTGNHVNLGDGSAATLAAGTNLDNAALYGGNQSDVTGNTLNVMVKDAKVQKAQNFENYTFHLTDHIAADKPSSGRIDDSFTRSTGTMLTLANGFDGQEADWSKVTIDTSRLSADKTLGAITLMKSDTADGLTFRNYAPIAREAGVTSGDYEVVQRTDTTDTGTTVRATTVLIDVNRYKNGNVTYDGTSGTKTYAGVSYGGNTAENNTMTLTGIAAGDTVRYLSGGRSEGTAGGAVNNTVNLVGTGTGTLGEVYGGYVGNAANAAGATGNTVNITGGSAQTIYGGYTNGAGKTTGNTVNLGDGTGFTAGADFSNTSIYGGSKVDDVTGNTLNVKGKDMTVGAVGNFDVYKFHLNDAIRSGDTMLNLRQTGGFTAPTDFARIDVDENTVRAWGANKQGANRITLLSAAGMHFTGNTPARLLRVQDGVEYGIHTDTGTNTADKVMLDANRFKDGAVEYTAASAGEALGGYSALGNTTENNTLTVTGVAPGASVSAYGGKTVGAHGGAKDNKVLVNGTGEGSLTNVYGGAVTNAGGGGDVTGNTVTLTGGTVTGDVYGGYTAGAGATTGNIVNLAGGSVGGTVAGGNKGAAGNALHVTGPVTAGQLANFETVSLTANRDMVGRTLLTVNGGAATTGLDWQKLTADVTMDSIGAKSYEATRVTLMANDKGIDFGTGYHGAKELSAPDGYEIGIDTDTHAGNGKAVYADGYRFKGNTAATYGASDSAHEFAWGGRSELGKTAEDNVLTVTGGTITDTAYGGTSRRGKAQNNKLVMRGGEAQTLKGGFGESASGNTVDVFGGTVRGDVYGGHATAGDAAGNTVNLLAPVTVGGTIHGGMASGASTNNTLAVHSFGAKAKDIDNVQNLHFYLPAGTTSAETRTMLTLTNAPVVKDISTLNLGVAAVAADARALRPGDAVSLLKTNGTLTTAAQLRNTGNARTMSASHGGILDYTLSLAKRGENELIATVETVTVNDRSKSPVETCAAATAAINAGADLLTNMGMAAAADAAGTISAQTLPTASEQSVVNEDSSFEVDEESSVADPADEVGADTGKYQLWAAQGGSNMRINSGSYVDAKGWNLNVGFARENKVNDATLMYGPFVEYGRSSYDSYLDDGTHGSGKVSYIGGGVMAKLTQESGSYIEGSLCAGRLSRDYTGSGDAADLSYDDSSTYFAGHIGLGQEWKLAGGDKIEGYAKYFYSHQGGNTTTLRSGAELDFGDVNSHRLRVGARYTHADSARSEVYAGLAYEYEFDGGATATYQGYATPSPSIGGGTGILELGYRFAPKSGSVSYGVNLMGMQGKRDGIAGSVQVNWAF